MLAWAGGLPKGRPLVAYCVHGHEVSQGVAKALNEAGIRAAIIEGGIKDGSIASSNAKIASFLLAGSIHGMAAWYEPAGPMKLSAITSQYVQILTAGLATSSMAGVAERGSLSFRSGAHLPG